MSQIRKSHKLWIAFISSICIIGIAWWFSFKHLNFTNVQRWSLELQQFTNTHIILTTLGLVAIQALSMLFTLPTKAIFNIVAGALLGFIGGAVVTLCGALIGTTGLFFFFGRLFSKPARHRIPDKLKKFEQKIQQRPLLTVASLRMILALPYGAITIFCAIGKIPYRPFIIGSLLGDIPVVALYSAAGLKLAQLANAKEAVSLQTIVILSIAGASLLAGTLWPNRAKQTPKEESVS